MENFSSINQDKFDRLLNLTSHHGKAIFLDKIIFWWQISKFSLNDNQKWFSRTIEFFSQELKISPRTVGRYLKEFSDKGWIEKVCKLRTKKILYVRVTNNLLNLIKNNRGASNKGNNVTSIFLTEDDFFEKDKMALSLNKDKDINNIVNNIVISNNVNCVKKQKTSFTKTIFPIEKVIGERVGDEIKNKIKGMLHNVLKPQQQELKNNERLFTEVLFTITNKEQVKDISCVNHRINIAAKLIRKKQWKTPKGFYNHWDVGQAYKEREEVKLRKIQQEKLERELLGVTNPQLILEIKARFEQSMEEENRFDKKKGVAAEPKKHNPEHTHQRHLIGKLKEISNEIYTQEKYLKQMEEALQKGLRYVNQELIDSIGIKLSKLYDEQASIEDELKNLRQEWYLCA